MFLVPCDLFWYKNEPLNVEILNVLKWLFVYIGRRIYILDILYLISK